MLMMPQTGELYTYPKNDFEIQRGMPPEDTLDERLRFVKAMNWFPEQFSDDWDVYDSRKDTYHFARRDESGSIIASMRLTPVESIESSLSYEMIGANQEFQSTVRESQAAIDDGAIWDLTRLVYPLDGRHDSKTVHKAIVELFGMAAHVSAGHVEDAEKDVYWIFATTPWTMRFFKQTGIESRTLAEGKLPDIKGKFRTTPFCLVDVASAIETLKMSTEHQDTYDHLRRGAGEAEAEVAYV